VGCDVGGSAGPMASVHGEKVDHETDRAEWSHLVVDLRRNGLGRARPQLDFEGWPGRSDKSQSAVVYNDASPRTRADAVGVQQGRRHGALVPLRAGANQADIFRQLGSVAQRTLQQRPKPLVPSLVLHHPRVRLERRSVTDVLIMTAGKLSHPVALVISPEAGDSTLHEPSVPGGRSLVPLLSLHSVQST
jgi:hypothetical protein